MAQLIIIRGLPGSGKSTIAKDIVSGVKNCEHLEADMFFMKDGVYCFEKEKQAEAHQWCIQKTKELLEAGVRIIVSNTFTRVSEMEPYFDLTYDYMVVEAKGNYQNVHNVPQEVLDAMQARWEPFVDTRLSKS